MQDHQVYLQYFAEEHLRNFHGSNVTTKKSCQWFESQVSETVGTASNP